jgi:hypothetical protein
MILFWKHHEFFFENNCGAKPPATNILIKGGRTNKRTKSLKRGRGKQAPNQQLGLGEVYQKKTTQKRRSKKQEERYTIWPQANLKCTDVESF